jgi:competence ComEA-like helix-hairpin-helix protein
MRIKIGGFMRRKLFFFLEKLQVTRRERVSIGFLLICLLVLGSLNLLIEQKAVYNEEYYEELERVFGERSRQAEAERMEILARYRPEEAPLPAGTAASVHTAGADTAGREENDPPEVPGKERININTAGPEELQQLPGIGPAYADRIIALRQKNGLFESIEQLLEIRGIGPRRLEALEPLIKLNEEPEPEPDNTMESQ